MVMKRLSNRLYKRICLYLILICIFLFRIVYVNTHSINETRREYEMGEWIPLSGDFVNTADEMTDGYYLRVESANFFTYKEYMSECGYPEYYFGTDIRSPVIELKVSIRNENNENGFLAISKFNLLNETKTISNTYNPIYAGLKNSTLETAFGATIRPQTEFTIYLPFTMQYGPENRSYLAENRGNGVYYFVISKYPTRKEVKITVE